MRTSIAYYIERIKAAFWIVPAVITGLILALLSTSRLGGRESPEGWLSFFLYDASPEGARLILSAIATSLITVVGVLFSILVVVFQQVASQYSPRVIHNFIRATPNQVVLGFFIGTFTYSILLLRQIRGTSSDDSTTVPSLALSVAIVLAVICVGLLIYFIHHILLSIRSTAILQGISKETQHVIRNVATDQKVDSSNELHPIHRRHAFNYYVKCQHRGYLQHLDLSDIKRCTTKNMVVEILINPGDYVYVDSDLCRISSSQQLEPKKLKAFAKSFTIGPERTISQDPRYGVQQMTDIALKALSPAMNDPTTASEAIHEIGAVLFAALGQEFAEVEKVHRTSAYIFLPHFSHDSFVELCFGSILMSCKQHPIVCRRIEQLLDEAQNRRPTTDWLLAIKKFRAKQSAIQSIQDGPDLISHLP